MFGILTHNILSDGEFKPWSLKHLSTKPQAQSMTEEHSSRQSLNHFFQQAERRAYRIALIATGNHDDALDLVQDAMCKLTERYADKSNDEWHMLFHSILQSKIKDWYRRQNVRNRWNGFFGKTTAELSQKIEQSEAPQHFHPDEHFRSTEAMTTLDQAVHQLPLRQQQAFLLRLWEGLDTRQTAKVMKCSEGSVKTHYSRSLKALQKKLGDYKNE